MKFSIIEKRTKLITDAFDISLILKGIDGILEILAGLILVLIPLERINNLVFWLTKGELAEDKKDYVANLLLRLSQTLSIKAYDFTIIYLLIHGFVKVFLVVMLLKKVLWAYPVAMIIFFIFGVYQTYQFTLNHSYTLLLLTILDMIVIILTWLEYTILLRKAREV